MKKRYYPLLFIPFLSLTACNSVSEEAAINLLGNMIDPQVEGDYLYWTFESTETLKRADGLVDLVTAKCTYSRAGDFDCNYYQETTSATGEKNIRRVNYIGVTSVDGYDDKVCYAKYEDKDGVQQASKIGDYSSNPEPIIYWVVPFATAVPGTYDGEHFNKLEIPEEMNEDGIVVKRSFHSTGNGNLTIRVNESSKRSPDNKPLTYYTVYKYDKHYFRSLYEKKDDIADYSKEGLRSIRIHVTYKATAKYLKEYKFELPSDWQEYLDS